MAELPYQAEYAKSGRAACKGCKENIYQGDLRFAVKVQSAFYDGKQLNWHHEECFFKDQRPATVTEISNFIKLKHDDQVRVKEAIENNNGIVMPELKKTAKRAAEKDSSVSTAALEDFRVEYSNNSRASSRQLLYTEAFKCDVTPVKKLKAVPKNEDELQENTEKEKKIEEQNHLFHEHRKALSNLKKRDLKKLLEENSQAVPVGRDECLDRLADIMAFGALEPCPECKQGQLELDTCGYRCTGYISKWTKCLYETQEPKREPMIIPNSYEYVEPFTRFRPKADVRLFIAEPRPRMVIVKDEKTESENIPIPPLKNLQFFVYGKLSEKEETKTRILKLGGLIVSQLTDTTVAAVSTRMDLERMKDKMKQIQQKDIMVIEESFLDKVDPEMGTIADSLDLIRECNIAEWGADPASKVPQAVLDGMSIRKSISMYVSAPPSKTPVKLKIKGGTAVDPASDLADVAHVYVDECGVKHTAALCQFDVGAQKNSYYKLQLLETDDGKKYYLFCSWGKIGTTNGGTNQVECESEDDAVYRFENKYMEKTGNHWHCRDTFEKIQSDRNE